MSLPDFVKHFFPDLPLEKSREMLQEILKVINKKLLLFDTCAAAWNQMMMNVVPGCPVQGEHRPPGGVENRGQVRGVRPCAPGPRQGHHDLHAPDEVHVQVRDQWSTFQQSTYLNFPCSNMMAGTEPAGKRQRVA